MIFSPHTNTVILLEPYCGTITEPGLPVGELVRSLKPFSLQIDHSIGLETWPIIFLIVRKIITEVLIYLINNNHAFTLASEFLSNKGERSKVIINYQVST